MDAQGTTYGGFGHIEMENLEGECGTYFVRDKWNASTTSPKEKQDIYNI